MSSLVRDSPLFFYCLSIASFNFLVSFSNWSLSVVNWSPYFVYLSFKSSRLPSSIFIESFIFLLLCSRSWMSLSCFWFFASFFFWWSSIFYVFSYNSFSIFSIFFKMWSNRSNMVFRFFKNFPYYGFDYAKLICSFGYSKISVNDWKPWASFSRFDNLSSHWMSLFLCRFN